MVSGYEYDDERMSKDMLEDIRDRNQFHTIINSIETLNKICDRI